MFRPLYYLGEKSEVNKKITFECSFIAQNPFQTILGLQKIFKIFFKKFEIFICFDPYTTLVKKVKSTKNHF